MKRKLLKVIGISFLIYVVLSWIIPVGTYSNGELTTNGIDPVGLIDLFNAPIQAFITFILYGVVFATIGGLYGVMERTGALEKVTDRMSHAFEGKERVFLVITVVLFTLLSSITGLILPLFVLVPLFAAVLFAMNFDKVTVLASTVGSLLVGSVASTYGFNITGYTANLLALDMNNQIVAKVILLVLLTIVLCAVVLMTSKKDMKKELKEAKMNKEEKEVKEVKEEKKVKASETKTAKKKAAATSTKKTSKESTKKAPKTTAKKASTKTTGKKKSTKGKANTKAFAVAKPVKKVSEKSKVSAVPMVIIFLLMLIVCLIGMYNWYYSFGIEVFSNIHEAIMGVQIGDFPIFEHLLSGVSELGYWSNIDLAAMMIIASAIIAWIYRLSFNDYMESFIAGVKKWLPTAIYAALASVILYILYQASYAGTGTLVDTINAKIFDLTDGFNVLTTGAASLIGSFFYNDLYYLLAALTSFVSGFDAASLSVAGLLIQSVYGVAMLIFPTSVILVAGLSLFDVSYKEWMKYIWKFALIALLLVLLTCGIVTLL
ncbi:c4-dicarboxylate anaerobic carrier arginine transporter [Firmicutes bacterium CAG:822]|nr:c4-dicarboxylate anaerobic carrier arginine transporter [Firmicutes bacterium CAG:822]